MTTDNLNYRQLIERQKVDAARTQAMREEAITTLYDQWLKSADDFGLTIQEVIRHGKKRKRRGLFSRKRQAVEQAAPATTPVPAE